MQQHPVEEMMIFALVVKEGSFTAAAKVLGIQKSNVSRKVAKLEDKLKVKLLHRSTRSLSMTEAGQIYFKHCLQVSKEVEAAKLAVTQMQTVPTGELNIAAPVAFGPSVLADLLADFLNIHPQISVNIFLTDQPVDLLKEGIDIAFGAAPLVGTNYSSKRIGHAQRVVCASPSYLEKHGEPKEPKDLLEHHSVIFKNWLDSDQWEFNQSNPKHSNTKHSRTKHSIKLKGTFLVNDLATAQRATLQGIGLALLPVLLVYDDLQNGRLVSLLQKWKIKPNALFLSYSSSLQLSAKVSALLDFIEDHYKENPPWGIPAPYYKK